MLDGFDVTPQDRRHQNLRLNCEDDKGRLSLQVRRRRHGKRMRSSSDAFQRRQIEPLTVSDGIDGIFGQWAEGRVAVAQQQHGIRHLERSREEIMNASRITGMPGPCMGGDSQKWGQTIKGARKNI